MNREFHESAGQPPIGQLIRSARQQLHLSQYALADRLARVSGRPTVGRDRVARWERGRQVPRREWRRWLAVVLEIPPDRLDAGAVAARQQNRLGQAVATTRGTEHSGTRRQQGTPALLPVFRSRVQAGILAATLLNPHRAFSLTELADHAGGSLASVSKEAKLLEEAGILVTRHEGAIRLMRAASDKPTIGPLTELIRVTYGVPQIIGEEFSRVAAVARIALVGTWAERFAGVLGPEPDAIQLRLTARPDATPDPAELHAAATRARRRLHRPVQFSVAPTRDHTRLPHRRAATGTLALPRQRSATAVVRIAPFEESAAPVGDAWKAGADVIARLLSSGQLELFSGPGADGRPYFDAAQRHLTAAVEVAPGSPRSAFILVCQAAHTIGCGLLAAQGLRPAAGSSGDVVSQSTIAQFGEQFEHLELLRQRQATLNYPTGRDNTVTAEDVDGALPAIEALLSTARDIALRLDLFV
ncbi:Helix-turn-helix domain-containing protein [Jiangella alkaliphila]|uniref:Helix-turn-helix domain-containing protein n=1 Tax=Jiangella alkaliphila TaxID=419479 RepID=A0A1H2K414_9ACTN|nr:Helix-turn-helix domain-containing protein [Jiangella alkaliphila]